VKRLEDEALMRKAFALAQLGEGLVGMDPLVGVIFVKDQQIITQGYHQKLFALHAEYDAFKLHDYNVQGSTVYVTLEPCAHDDYFPSCAGLLIRKGVKRVIIASLDPNPIENGDGLRKLQAANIQVEVGLFHEENLKMNTHYFARFK
jgi:diaminohydroxyphosphoribosylaminopyrimidine deaminase / 5-amino-6-(5-phosphoribosylamino)uracil reductase